MKRISILLLLFVCGLVTAQDQDYIHSVTKPDQSHPAQTSKDDKYANMVSVETLKKHLYIIASDEFEGRGTGEPGIDKAADYISGELASAGVKPYPGHEYYQPIAITYSGWDTNKLFVNGESHRHLWDYLAFPDKNRTDLSFSTDEVIFLGYGIEDKKYNDYRSVDVTGKVIMIYGGEPKNKKGKYVISGNVETASWTLDKKLITAKEHGVKMVLVIDEDIKQTLADNRSKILGSVATVGKVDDTTIKGANHLVISSTLAKKIIGDKLKKVAKSRKKAACKKRFKPVSIPVDLSLNANKRSAVIEGKNIIAFIPGTDASKSKEIVVVSAHYDHLGKRGDVIYNGADDDGSGTTTVLTLATAMQKAYDEGNGSPRPTAFIFMTGEEKGLLGSKYFVSDPIFPLDEIMVDVNVDMVGRVDEKYQSNPEYIYVIGSDRLSTDLHKINEDVNEKYSKLILDYTYNSEKDPNRYYYRSDHYNFAANGIPSIFFFNGTHEDYHKHTDTPDKINYNKMSSIGKHIFHLIRALGERSRLKVDGIVK